MNQLSRRYLEDFAVGQTFGSGRLRIDKEQIFAFAAEFDPQPFHLDEAAARDSIFGGLAASGWHTGKTFDRTNDCGQRFERYPLPATSLHSGSRVIHSTGRRFSPYQIRYSLGNGDHGSVGVSADDGRHDRCIDHSETLDTEDTELRVDDPANPARARRMIEGLRVAFDKGPDVRVAAGCRHEMRGPADRG